MPRTMKRERAKIFTFGWERSSHREGCDMSEIEIIAMLKDWVELALLFVNLQQI
jgi:hypothetical protein